MFKKVHVIVIGFPESHHKTNLSEILMTDERKKTKKNFISPTHTNEANSPLENAFMPFVPSVDLPCHLLLGSNLCLKIFMAIIFSPPSSCA